MSPIAQTITVEVMGIPAFREAMEQLRAERDAAQAELAKPREDWREDWQASFDSLTAEYDKQFARADAAQAEAARYKALWDAVPWAALYDPSEAHNRYDIEQWYDAHAPKPQGEEA